MSGKRGNCKILMFPWLAHGHISPFAELARRLVRRNFDVILCSTPVNLEPFRKSINDPLLQFVELHLSSTKLPNKYHTTKNLPTHLMPTLKAAFDESKENFRNILKTIEPDVLIYDFLQPWAPQVALEEGVSSAVLLPCGAACFSFVAHYCVHPEMEFPLESLRFSETERENSGIINAIINSDECKERFLRCFERSSASFILINSSNRIEANYVSYLSKLVNKEVVPVGLLVQEVAKKPDDSVFLDWLSQKSSKSVVFVSFGSEYFLTKREIEEVALGLEISKVCFIWVVRFPPGEKTSLDEALPPGFRKRLGDRGMVVEGWAPQATILSHSSVGWFLSHCGWNSILEAITCRVCVIAMPMQLDQPMNSKLVTDLGIGIEVPRDGRRYTRGRIARAIEKVVVEGDGKEMERNVDMLSSEVGGNGEFDAAVERLVQLAQGYQ